MTVVLESLVMADLMVGVMRGILGLHILLAWMKLSSFANCAQETEHNTEVAWLNRCNLPERKGISPITKCRYTNC